MPLTINILQGAFLPVPPLRGGAVEKAWVALGSAFAEAGHTVTHQSRTFPGLAKSESIGRVLHRRVSGFEAPLSLKFRLLLDLFYTLRAVPRLPKAEILITNTFWAPIVCRNYSKGLPYVHVARYPKGQLKYYSKRAILQTVSEPIKRAILQELPGAESRLSVIPYPLTNKFLDLCPRKDSRTILYAGRVHPEKGLELLIQAFGQASAELPGWELKVVGPHEANQGGGGREYRSKLEALARDLPITFVGPLFGEQALREQYEAAAIFAYPSLAEKGETFGLAVLEAMARGCAPIVSELGCFKDFVVHEGNGLIFDHRSSAALELCAQSIVRLAKNEGLREQLSQAALATARNYSLEHISTLFLRDFSKRLQEAHGS